MIRELKTGSRLFYPRRLLNSLVRWVLGVHSPEGTIKVQNTATPNEKSIALDVDMAAIISKMNERNVGMTDAQRQDSADIMRAHLDGTSLIWTNEVATINKDWLARQLETSESGEGATLVPLGTSAAESYSDGGSIGASEYAARYDHTHRLPTAAEVTNGDSTVAADLATIKSTADDAKTAADEAKTTATNAETTASTAQSTASSAASAASAAQSAASSAASAASTANTTATNAKTAADNAQAELDKVTTGTGDARRVQLSKITGNISGHTGNCYVTIGNDGSLGHSSNRAYNLLNTAATTKTDTATLITSDDVGANGAAWLKTAQNSTTATKLITDDDFDLTADEVETLQNVATEASSTTASTTAITSGLNNSAGTAWTTTNTTTGAPSYTEGAASGKGVSVFCFTREAFYSGTNDSGKYMMMLYGRTFTYDHLGRLTGISAESSISRPISMYPTNWASKSTTLQQTASTSYTTANLPAPLDTTTWNSQNVTNITTATTNLVFDVISRCVKSSQINYLYMRTITFSPSGGILQISAENKVIPCVDISYTTG